MSKIIKKSDITTLVESTMKQAGILKEDMNGPEDIGNHGDSPCDGMDIRSEEYKECMGEKELDETSSSKVQSANTEYEEKGMTTEEEDLEESEEDVVTESTNRLAGQASEHNTISENLKKDLASFNKIINYKY